VVTIVPRAGFFDNIVLQKCARLKAQGCKQPIRFKQPGATPVSKCTDGFAGRISMIDRAGAWSHNDDDNNNNDRNRRRNNNNNDNNDVLDACDISFLRNLSWAQQGRSSSAVQNVSACYERFGDRVSMVRRTQRAKDHRRSSQGSVSRQNAKTGVSKKKGYYR
jgi:hypothetical protein